MLGAISSRDVPGSVFYQVPSTGYLTNPKKWKKSKPSICLDFLI